MKSLSKDGKQIIRRELSKKEALDLFKDDEYKIDLIENLDKESIITCYSQRKLHRFMQRTPCRKC